jgi:hypothetical protein
LLGEGGAHERQGGGGGGQASTSRRLAQAVAEVEALESPRAQAVLEGWLAGARRYDS